MRCDTRRDCSDGSDEIRCICNKDQFACGCDGETNCETDHCIPIQLYHDGFFDCFDYSDEDFVYFRVFRCGDCEMNLYRLDNISACNDLASCDNSTCFETLSQQCHNDDCVETQVICSSYFPDSEINNCYPIYQCDDGSLFLAYGFCDRYFDCLDGTDELYNVPGLKCTQTRDSCVLPHINVHDNIAHCDDQSDLLFNNVTGFSCLHGRFLISSKQVCDGVIDCYDFSDECLCKHKINHPNCKAFFSLKRFSKTTCTFTTPISIRLIKDFFNNNPMMLYCLTPGSATVNFTELLTDSVLNRT